MTEQAAMERALKLALEGWGRVQPNPMVGAVIIKDGKSLGEGAHREFGGPHAEVEALESAGPASEGSTCVVTLEPCSHHGKTPPCTDRLIEAGVRRVVYAIADPNPKAAGGESRLAEAGIEVQSGVMAEEARHLNAQFHLNQLTSERPFVALKLATSLDGYLADRNRNSRWISGPQARDWVQWVRAGFDAIGVGRNTAVEDDPALTVRGELKPRRTPTRVIFSKKGEIPRGLSIFKDDAAPTVVFVEPDHASKVSSQLAGGRDLDVVSAGGVPDALKELRDRGVHSLLVEGGGELAASLLEQEVVDRVYWIQSPVWLGQGVAAFPKRRAVDLADATRWQVVERQAMEDDTLLVVDRKLCLPES